MSKDTIGSGPYFTEETVTELAEGQRQELASGLAALAARLDYDSIPDRPEEYYQDQARRKVIRDAWQAEWREIRYSYRDGLPAYPLTDALGIPTGPRDFYYDMLGDKTCPSARVEAAIPTEPHEMIDGVWEHRGTGEQVIRIVLWTLMAWSGMRQPDTFRTIPVVNRIEGGR